jgi:hypothetical protein
MGHSKANYGRAEWEVQGMTYQEALAELQNTTARNKSMGRAAVLFGYTGGRKRYIWLDAPVVEGEAISVWLFKTQIATIYADDSIQLYNGGYDTATTREALRYLLGRRGALFANYKGQFVFTAYGSGQPNHEFVSGMVISSEGSVS